jgi:predicted Fe-S protein YdhL (DUF1289 family)
VTDQVDRPVASPCVSICALDENNVCLGCYRTAHEITEWSVMSNTEKQAVMRSVGERERAAMNFFNVVQPDS